MRKSQERPRRSDISRRKTSKPEGNNLKKSNFNGPDASQNESPVFSLGRNRLRRKLIGARGDANVVERDAVTGEERGAAVAQRAEIPTSALPPLPPGGRPTCFCMRDPQRFCHFVRPLVATPPPPQPYDAYEFHYFLTKFAHFDFCVPRDPSAITPLAACNFFFHIFPCDYVQTQ